MIVVFQKLCLKQPRQLQLLDFLSLGRRSVCISALVHANRLAHRLLYSLVNLCVIPEIGGHLGHSHIDSHQRHHQGDSRDCHPYKSSVMSY